MAHFLRHDGKNRDVVIITRIRGSAAAGVQAELRPAQADAAVETATYASAGMCDVRKG